MSETEDSYSSVTSGIILRRGSLPLYGGMVGFLYFPRGPPPPEEAGRSFKSTNVLQVGPSFGRGGAVPKQLKICFNPAGVL